MSEMIPANGENNKGRVLTKYDRIKNYARSTEIVQRFAEVVGEQGAKPFISSVMLTVANSQRLQECDPISIITSAMRAATLRLSCDPVTRQAWLVPFKGKCTFVIGYQGYRALALRTNRYRYLNDFVVYEGETVVEDRLTGIHTIEGHPTPSKTPIGYGLYIELYNGYRKSFYMTVEEIIAHAERYCPSYQEPRGCWQTEFHKMCKKTVIRLGLSNYGYFDPSDQMLMAHDDAEETEDNPLGLPGEHEITPPPTPRKRSEEEIIAELCGEKYTPEPEPTEQEAIEGAFADADIEPAASETPTLKGRLYKMAENSPLATQRQLMETAACLDYILRSTSARLEFLSALADRPITTSKELDPKLISAVHNWLQPKYDENGGIFYPQNREAEQEVVGFHRASLMAIGQMTLNGV